jgi:hypothetical protein
VKRWLLLDPATGARGEARGLVPDDHILAVLDDGALLVRRTGRGEPPVPNGVLLVDPESGSARRIVVAGLETASVVKFHACAEGPVPVRTPSGSRVFLVVLEGGDGRREKVFARLDVAEGRLVPTTVVEESPVAGHRSWVIAAPDEDHVLAVIGSRTIERLRFGSSARERLFPRGSE